MVASWSEFARANCSSVTVAQSRSAPLRFALSRLASRSAESALVKLVRLASRRFAPLKSALIRSALIRSAPLRSTPVRLASNRFALSRFAPLRSAPLRPASLRSAPLREMMRAFLYETCRIEKLQEVAFSFWIESAQSN